MTRVQEAILLNVIQEADEEIVGIEYPSHPQVEGGSNDCLKLTIRYVTNEVSRTWVQWYAADGYNVNGRELVECYDRPTFSERRDGAS